MNFEEHLKQNGYLVYTNVGVSMLPLIRQRKDLLYITTIDEELKFFDVVLFKRKGDEHKYILHRIIKDYHDGNYYIFGDNTYSGEVVNRANIVGILKKIKRGNKEISVNDKSYQLFVYLWYLSYPIRWLLHMLKQLSKRILCR